jgi:hypothetical protein
LTRASNIAPGRSPALSRFPRRRQNLGSGLRVNGRRSRSCATARRPPLTRRPRAGRLSDEEDGRAHYRRCSRREVLIYAPRDRGPACDGRGLPRPEAGADAGPAAPQRAALIQERLNSAEHDSRSDGRWPAAGEHGYAACAGGGVSDFGSQMGAAIHRQVRSDAVRRLELRCHDAPDVQECSLTRRVVRLYSQFGTKRPPVQIRPPRPALPARQPDRRSPGQAVDRLTVNRPACPCQSRTRQKG